MVKVFARSSSSPPVQFIGLDGKAHFEHALRKGT